MNLIKTFEQNLVDGFLGKSSDKTIETIVSKIFFYEEDVYKVYKYEKFFFGDFTDKDFRRNFYIEDFYWNHITAPHIYLALRPVKIIEGKYKIVDSSEAEDFFIEMRKFDDNKNLTNILLQKQISNEDIKKIVIEMTSRLKILTENKRKSLEYDFNKKLIDIHLADLDSDRNLLYLIPSFIKKEWADKTFNFLKKISINNNYFLNYHSNNLSLLIDNHADNIILSNGEVDFVDVLPPKESWRVGDVSFNICRLATDVAVLLVKDKADIVYQNYKDIPEQIKKIYEIRSALIQIWCFCAVNNLDIAKKYLNFAETKILSLKNFYTK